MQPLETLVRHDMRKALLQPKKRLFKQVVANARKSNSAQKSKCEAHDKGRKRVIMEPINMWSHPFDNCNGHHVEHVQPIADSAQVYEGGNEQIRQT